jgi:hypothetical protein
MRKAHRLQALRLKTHRQVVRQHPLEAPVRNRVVLLLLRRLVAAVDLAVLPFRLRLVAAVAADPVVLRFQLRLAAVVGLVVLLLLLRSAVVVGLVVLLLPRRSVAAGEPRAIC